MATFTASQDKKKVNFQLTTSPAQFQFTDLVDWGTGDLPALADRYVKIRITSPTGDVVYETNWDGSTSTDVNDWNGTNFDSDINAGDTTFNTSTVPVNSADNSLVQGNYKFEINTLYDQGGSSYAVVESTANFIVRYEKPEYEIISSVNLNPVSPELKILDDTSYTVDGVEPTKTLQMKFTPNPLSSLTDTTSSSGVITLSTFPTGRSFVELTSSNTASWDFSENANASETNTFTDGNFTLTVFDSVTGSSKVTVSSGTDFCSINCCLNETFTDWENAIKKGHYIIADRVFKKLATAATFITIALQNRACNSTKTLNSILATVKNILDCGDNCGCDDEPTVVQPITVGNTTNTSVITFTVPVGAGNTPVPVTSGDLVRTPSGGGNSTYQSALLTGLTYNTGNKDFDVYFDGDKDLEGTLDSSTGTFTFQTILSISVNVEISFK